jgi:hypothetical protein
MRWKSSQSLVALLVDSDFAWELRNILLVFAAAAAAAVAVDQSVRRRGL